MLKQGSEITIEKSLGFKLTHLPLFYQVVEVNSKAYFATINDPATQVHDWIPGYNVQVTKRWEWKSEVCCCYFYVKKKKYWGRGLFFSNPQAKTTQRHPNWSKLRTLKRKSSGPKKIALLPEETMVSRAKVLIDETLSKRWHWTDSSIPFWV